MEQQELIPHLFRTEYRKIVSVLCRRFGLDQIEIAEDITSDTFLAAAQTWAVKGLPPAPVAWLYNVAKNKAINYLQRNNLFDNKIVPGLKSNTFSVQEPEIDLSPKNIYDSQLQMMFAICHPSIPAEAQIGLALRILCGFGIEEIAGAFLVNKETISKRLFRAKEKLRSEKVLIEFPGESEINKRLETVLTTLYLLFNEGYYSESQDTVLREELCLEAMRLTYMLIENEQTNLPPVNALIALMCFHASRFEARKNSTGEIVLYQDQDETRWNYELITKGAHFLQQASTGNVISKYHLEASIAYWHTQKNDTQEKWETILQLYNRLLQVEYSPVAALNRTYALSKADPIHGKIQAIAEAEKLKLTDNYLYHSLLGELYTDIDNAKSILHLNTALSLAKTTADKKILSKKILLCEQKLQAE
ncbi:MAG: sigma-70 family RNA polymerase sigma factor [Chitinophagaceae bacterium]